MKIELTGRTNIFCSEEFNVGEVASVRLEGVVGVGKIDEVEG